MLFKKSKQSSKEDSSPLTSTLKEVELFIYLGATGYHLYIADQQEGKPFQSHNTEIIIHTTEKESHIENMLRMIKKEIPTSLRKRVTQCYILWDSQDLVFADTKIELLRAASPAVAREVGSELLNSKVIFGYTTFQSPQAARENGLYAFVDIKLINIILMELGDLALKVREIIPIEVILLNHAMQQLPYVPYGAMIMGTYYTKIILININLGVVMVRNIPIGIANLVSTVAQNVGTRVDEVLKIFKERDYLSGLTHPKGNQGPLSPQEQAMMPLIQKLKDELVATLDYFRAQRVCGIPQKIYILGAIERLSGLDKCLIQMLPMGIHGEIQNNTETLFNIFIKRKLPLQLNLLKGAEGPLISIGKIQYSFNEKDGMIKYTKPMRQTTTENLTRGHARTRRSAKEQTGLFAQLTKIFTSEQKDSTDIDENTYFILLGLFICGMLYIGYDQYAILNRSLLPLTNMYNKTVTDINTTRQKIQSQKVITIASAIENKVLWTEKFLAIGKHINDNLWLTDVYLDGKTQTTGKNILSEAKLVMKGSALPRTEGHVAVIADFVNGLTTDDSMFMSDFREITFSGFTIDTNDVDPIVRFTLEAHYAPEKRQAITDGETNLISDIRQKLDSRK